MFTDLWNKLAVKKPDLINPDSKVEITSANLKKLLQQFYDAGYKKANDTRSLFDNIFGKL